MTFEVINDKDNIMMCTHDISYIPALDILKIMREGNFRFRLDGKIISYKKLEKFLKEEANKEEANYDKKNKN